MSGYRHLLEPLEGPHAFLKTLLPFTRGLLLSCRLTYIDDRGQECLKGGKCYDFTGDTLSIIDEKDLHLLVKLGVLGLKGPRGSTQYLGPCEPHVSDDCGAAFIASLKPEARTFLLDAGLLTSEGKLRPKCPFVALDFDWLLSTSMPESELFTPAQFDQLRDFGLALPFTR